MKHINLNNLAEPLRITHQFPIMIYKITPSVESLYKPIKPLESTQSYEANGSLKVWVPV